MARALNLGPTPDAPDASAEQSTAVQALVAHANKTVPATAAPAPLPLTAAALKTLTELQETLNQLRRAQRSVQGRKHGTEPEILVQVTLPWKRDDTAPATNVGVSAEALLALLSGEIERVQAQAGRYGVSLT